MFGGEPKRQYLCAPDRKVHTMKNTINEEKKWKVLSSEYLVKRPWLTARRDVAELPDGRINHEYYVLEYPDWVNIIAITKDGQVVMERQYRHALGNTCYELPCGVIEAGETPLVSFQSSCQSMKGQKPMEPTSPVSSRLPS